MDGLWKVLDNNNKFERIVVSKEAELKPGDIQIYQSHGAGHINIYAGKKDGKYQYWDAGKNAAGAFIGKTKGAYTINTKNSKYTCSYRLKN